MHTDKCTVTHNSPQSDNDKMLEYLTVTSCSYCRESSWGNIRAAVC